MSVPHHESEVLDLVLDALANPLRRSLIERLTERDINVSDLAEGAGVSMPSISRHLRVLEKANLIVRLKRGRNHMISLRREPLHSALAWCASVAGEVAKQPAASPPVPDEPVIPFELSHHEPEPAPEGLREPDAIDLSPDSLSDLVRRLKRG